MTFARWCEKFCPLTTRDGGLRLFDPHSRYHRRLLADRLRCLPLTAWTLVETDKGDRIIEGFHYVNRLAYIFTRMPFRKGRRYEVAYD